MEGSDKELIAQHVAGDPRAFAEIVRRYEPRLRPKLERFLRQLEPDTRRATIDDILQEVWWRVVCAGPHLALQHNFAAWLFTVAINLALNEHRRRSYHAVRMPLVVQPDGATAEAEFPDGRPDTLAVLEAQETLAALMQYLRQHTSSKNLEVFELRICGYSHAAIAQIIGVPVGVSKMRFFRAQKAARQFRDENK